MLCQRKRLTLCQLAACARPAHEVSRKLTTGSKFDVQFNDMNARYGFGFSAFDNAQVRHAVHYEPLYLSFGK